MNVCGIIIHMPHGIVSAFFNSVWKCSALWTDVTIKFNACSTFSDLQQALTFLYCNIILFYYFTRREQSVISKEMLLS